MDEKDQYKTVITTLILIGIITVLISPPELLLQYEIMVDTTPYYTSPNRTWVRTRMELGDNKTIETLPFEIHNWSGYSIEIKKHIFEMLEPDIILERIYYSFNASKPVWFIIIRAENTSAFHDPKICYRGAGWNIINETSAIVELNGSIWSNDTFLKEHNEVRIKINKLLVEKDGYYKLIMYFYLKEFILTNSPGKITLIRAETTVDDLKKSSRRISDFLGEMLPYLFIPISEKGSPIFIYIYQTYGIIGLILEIILILLPIIYLGKLILKDKYSFIMKKIYSKIR